MNFISHGGGALLYVIVGVSVLAMALFFERALYLFLRLKLNMDKAFKKVTYHLQKPDYRAAIEECTRFEKHPLGRILKAGLLKSDKKDKEIERALEEKILDEIPRVKAKVNYLTLFANISTLLGLLGTIMGLITSFQSVSSANEAAKQEMLAQGISMAMSTTAAGLVVAIPCLIGYYILNNRGEFLVDQLEQKALGLANALAGLKRSGRV